MRQQTGSNLHKLARTLGALLVVALGASLCAAQESAKTESGTGHEDHILGVRIGMDVPTALQAVFVNAHRKPGQEKPDALRHEGKDKKDVRVLYKGLEVGDLEIVFADGKWVKEIMLIYSKRPTMNDLMLAPTGSIDAVTDRNDVLDSHLNIAKKYDDRYSIGYTSTQKTERYWWRDDPTPAGYHVRVGFISGRVTEAGAIADRTIYRKLITVKPEDEDKFLKAMGAS